ncbi:hypothetical protein [Bacillus atrophaeus]|nr:hypothetical protein [Bacillus atrophaeus]
MEYIGEEEKEFMEAGIDLDPIIISFQPFYMDRRCLCQKLVT